MILIIISGLIIVLLVILISVYHTIKTRYLITKGNFAEIVFNVRIAKMKFLKKYSFLLGFSAGSILGFCISWWLLVYKNGKNGKAITNFVLNFIDILQEKLCTLFLAIWDNILLISPYGRLSIPNEKYLYALNTSTLFVLLGLIICLVVMFKDSREFLFVKTILAIVHLFLHWYVMYFFCYLIVKISIFYKVLSVIAIALVSLFSWLLIMYPILNATDKLNSNT